MAMATASVFDAEAIALDALDISALDAVIGMDNAIGTEGGGYIEDKDGIFNEAEALESHVESIEQYDENVPSAIRGFCKGLCVRAALDSAGAGSVPFRSKIFRIYDTSFRLSSELVQANEG